MKIKTIVFLIAFQEFITNPKAAVKKLWKTDEFKPTVAMQWGIDHEEVAVLGFEDLYGKTQKCGLFIHRGFYFFGASPDRIWKNSLLEIKCSHVLRHTKPDAKGLDSLMPAQRNRHFLEKTVGNGVALKRNHKYYAQWSSSSHVFTISESTIFFP